MKELGREPGRWKMVYALSRSQKDEYPSNVAHSNVDLLSSAQDMAKELKSVEGEYIFFAAYLQEQDPEKETEVNS